MISVKAYYILHSLQSRMLVVLCFKTDVSDEVGFTYSILSLSWVKDICVSCKHVMIVSVGGFVNLGGEDRSIHGLWSEEGHENSSTLSYSRPWCYEYDEMSWWASC